MPHPPALTPASEAELVEAMCEVYDAATDEEAIDEAMARVLAVVRQHDATAAQARLDAAGVAESGVTVPEMWAEIERLRADLDHNRKLVDYYEAEAAKARKLARTEGESVAAELLETGPGKMDRTCPAVRGFLDRWVLQYMVDCSPGGYDFYGFPLRCFANDWITKDMARAICRDLTDRGLARFQRGGLFDEDGMTAGSGYGVTDKGREHLRALYKEEGASDAGTVEALREAALFLKDRLDEWQNENLTDEGARDWCGHVEPAVARLAALATTEGRS